MRRALVLILLSMVAVPAMAQSTRARLDDLELRVAQLEETVRGQALIELSQRLDALVSEARALRGDLEMLQQENEALRRQQRDLAADFDRRVGAIETRMTAMADAAAAAAVAAAPPSAPDSLTGATPETSVSGASMGAGGVPPAAMTGVPAAESAEIVYGRAFDQLKAAKYPEAITGMTDFLLRFPSHPLADNAQYWLGQAHYVTRDYARALEAFSAVGSRSADSSKAPDALLKKGLAESELGRSEAARATLNEVIRRYPQNDAARLAREQLLRLR